MMAALYPGACRLSTQFIAIRVPRHDAGWTGAL